MSSAVIAVPIYIIFPILAVALGTASFIKQKNKKTSIFLMILGLILLISLIYAIKKDIDDSSYGWRPWFSFYRSRECLVNENSECFLRSFRSTFYPKSFKEAFDDMDTQYTASDKTTSFNKLNLKVDVNDWICQETSSHLGRKVDPNNQVPRMDYEYSCWPKEPLPSGITLTY